MIYKQLNEGECVEFSSTGFCSDSNCNLKHNEQKGISKKKLKLKKGGNVFKPTINPKSNEVEVDKIPVNSFSKPLVGCPCCKGMSMNCKSEECSDTGICKCILENNMGFEPQEEKIKVDEDEVFIDHFHEESSDCTCCNGYIYDCNGPTCYGNCFCAFEEYDDNYNNQY